MTSKERVLSTINHKRPDRVSATFKGTPEIDSMVMKHFGLKGVEEIKNVFPVDNLHWPWRNISPKNLDETKEKDGVVFDIWDVGKKAVNYGIGTYEEVAVNPLSSAQTVEDIKRYSWPKVSDLDFSNIPKECDKYSNEAIGGCIWTVFEKANQMRGFEQFLTDLAINKDIAWAIIEKISDFNHEYNQKLVETSNGRIDIMGTGDDFGSQVSLLMSVDMWKKYFLPGIRKAYAWGKKNGLKVSMHNDGAIKPLIPHLIEAGLDVLDPVMPLAKDMVLEELIKEFGKDLSFHGTIDVQELLPFGKSEEVYTETKMQIERYAQNGGFFMAPSHMIQPGTPLENILAMYEALRKVGRFSG